MNKRFLATVAFCDIVGYTAMMQQDEANAMSKRHRFKALITDKLSLHNGTLIQQYGDGCLCIFSNARICLLIVCLCVSASTNAQLPRWYQCLRTNAAPVIDGHLDDRVWRDAPWSESFVDIQGASFPKPTYDTRFKMLWDEDYLYVGVWLEEPHIRGRLRQRDTVIFYDNDIEIFIDPDGDHYNYGELEINALNTAWDLRLTKPYRDAGRALNEWDIAGIKHEVGYYGTLNEPSDIDSGWVAEWAIPMSVIDSLREDVRPTVAGDHWKVNFSRVQWPLVISKNQKRYVHYPVSGEENNWSWSPQGKIAMHMPEKWGIIVFQERLQSLEELPPAIHTQELYRSDMMNIYHQLRKLKVDTNASADSLNDIIDGMSFRIIDTEKIMFGVSDVNWYVWHSAKGLNTAIISHDGKFSYDQKKND